MGDIIGLISGKGGVGKTTITACLGAALSEQGYRVLLCDGDFGLRDLDIILGKEDEVCFDAYNALEDKSMADDVVMKVQDNLYFLPASQSVRWEDMGRKKYRKLVSHLAKSYDYVLVDCPAGIGRGLESIVELAQRFLIVTQPLWVSIRNAAFNSVVNMAIVIMPLYLMQSVRIGICRICMICSMHSVLNMWALYYLMIHKY